MKVKCVQPYPTPEQIERLGDFHKKQAFGVTVGNVYLVLALEFHIKLPGFGTGVMIQFLDDDGHIGFAPLFLFEIVDGRPSKHWECRFRENGSLTLQPPSFYREYYHDDLSEDVPEVVEDFKRVRALLESESEKPKEGPTILSISSLRRKKKD